MIVVLKQDSDESDIARVNSKLVSLGLQTQVSVGSSEGVIGLIGNTSVINEEEIKVDKSVEDVFKVKEPFKKAKPTESDDSSYYTLYGRGGITLRPCRLYVPRCATRN